MNILKKRDLPMHRTALGWLYIFGNSFLLPAVFGFFLLPLVGAIARNADIAIVLSSRAKISAEPRLVNFLSETVIGIYALFVLQQSAIEYFECGLTYQGA